MIRRSAELVLLLVLTACAAHREARSTEQIVLREKSPGLFVGHSQSGDVVVAASHYAAMHGLAVADVDLGLPARNGGGGAMVCNREMVTGSHVPKWYCRYAEDSEATRLATRNALAFPVFSPEAASSNRVVPMMMGTGPAGSRTHEK
jgi:hypothetical protein